MRTLFWLAICLIIFSCDREIHITQPIIIIKGEVFETGEAIPMSVIEHAEIDGDEIEPDYYKWEIVTEDLVIVYADFPNAPEVVWIPDSSGYFFVRLTIGYDSNKSISLLEEIAISPSPESLQKKLIGEWIGEAEYADGFRWKLALEIDSTGHYIGRVLEMSDSARWPIGPFYYGCYLIDNHELVTWLPDVPEPIEAPGSPRYVQTCIQLSEDIPCASLVITEVRDGLGFAELGIGFEYEIWGGAYHAECSDFREVANLSFSGGNNVLHFELFDPYYEDYQWIAKFELRRI